MKLIASDLDGTLLLNGNTQVSDELFRLIDAYQKQGVLFCAASGRQYNSLRGLFAPVADDILYLCENGAVVFYKGKVLGKTCIPREDEMCIRDRPCRCRHSAKSTDIRTQARCASAICAAV